MERLAGATADELAAEEGLPECEAAAAERGFRYLGHAKVDAMAALQKEPGSLAERRWEQVSFQLPESTLAGCWWLTNPFHRAAAHDGAEERNPEKETPVFVYRSLAILVAELHQQRVATVAKMSEELRARRERNLELAGQLSHTRLWLHHGPRRWVEGFLAAATGRGALSSAISGFPRRATTAVGRLRVLRQPAWFASTNMRSFRPVFLALLHILILLFIFFRRAVGAWRGGSGLRPL